MKILKNKLATKTLSTIAYILVLTPLLLNSINVLAMFTPARDHYAALGLTEDATDSQIRAAFIQLARKWHPDRFLRLTAEEQAIQRDKWLEIAEAWNILKNQTKETQLEAAGIGIGAGVGTGTRSAGASGAGGGTSSYGAGASSGGAGSEISSASSVKTSVSKSEIERLLKMAKQAMATSANGMSILSQLAKTTASEIDRATRLGHLAEAKILLTELNDIVRNASAISGSTSTTSDAKIFSELRELSRLATAKIARLEASSGSTGAGDR